MIAEHPQETMQEKTRQGLALPLYVVALLLSCVSDLLGDLAAWRGLKS